MKVIRKLPPPLEKVTARLEELLREKNSIVTDKTWRRHSLSETESVFRINCEMYKILTNEDYPHKWEYPAPKK